MRYEIRALSLVEILDTAFRLLRNHFALLVGISATVSVPAYVLGAAVGRLLDQGPAERSLPTMLVGSLGVVLILTTAWTIITAAITYACAELYCGRTPSWRAALARGQRSFVPLVGTTLLSGVLVTIGLLLLLAPGIYLTLSWVILWPVMVTERCFGMRALRRSRELMRGHLLRALGLLIVVGLISNVLSASLTLPFLGLPRLQMLASGVVSAVTTAYGAAATVLLYFDVRSRKEAFDLTHLAEIVGGGAEREVIEAPA
jgi:hypothetical protein